MTSGIKTERSRVRRPAERAREEILDAAERRLVQDGPAALRMQAVARDVGITDANVHYHFGSRDALLKAVFRRAARRLRGDVANVLEQWEPEPAAVVELAELLRFLYTDRGYTRLTAWLSLTGWHPSGSGLLRVQADALHRRRAEELAAADEPPADHLDTLFSLALLNVAVWSEPLIMEAVLAMFGLPGDEAGVARFRGWLAHLVADHLAST